MVFDDLQLEPVFCGISRWSFPGVTLIHVGQLHILTRGLLDGQGQLLHLRAVLFIGRSHFQRQKVPQSIHCSVDL